MRAAVLVLVALAGCSILNRDLEGRMAPALQSGDWVDDRAPVGAWRVVSFFAPG